MPDFTQNNQNPNLPPPKGDPIQAEKYINQLIQLIDQDKLEVCHTDLSKFDPTTLQDHYQLDLSNYRLEISHSKHPNSGHDSFVILFTNIKNILDGNCQKIILAYMYLDANQFTRFKKVSLEQVEKKQKAEEEKRLKEALEPVDQVLQNLSADSTKESLLESFPAVS
ncbi:hypothetical protein A3C26_02535 [Candidatus Daviesbacteria bacterium RIFCSPHIGHO2_02_FULL_39_12]|uniref:Uncharacterized protein n=2 Tax=Candidatus Daviesiibacteriota TaxID=1752718 RepID=A0A1F5J9Z7_9BACT|nr:MAG: hypothetical protein A3C26_02535 [Candidatus Daviesbacteria bacterium RIFCSPHIGHO2_02_FULL_39_12]OGE71487.1 MAG: hypothetical protein A3H40_03100 [Candidatus Daviesbacteria bacterium RIFCSPLOWO2_02_FULL_38_15]